MTNHPRDTSGAEAIAHRMAAHLGTEIQDEPREGSKLDLVRRRRAALEAGGVPEDEMHDALLRYVRTLRTPDVD
jgi:hypothetical protein